MKITKDILLKELDKYLILCEIEYYNNNTFLHSQGYRKGTEDIIKFIKNYEEE